MNRRRKCVKDIPAASATAAYEGTSSGDAGSINRSSANNDCDNHGAEVSRESCNNGVAGERASANSSSNASNAFTARKRPNRSRRLASPNN